MLNKCPQCDGTMKAGFVVDANGRGCVQSMWTEGEMWSFMLNNAPRIPVTTFRCEHCGYLSSFANPQQTRNKDDD